MSHCVVRVTTATPMPGGEKMIRGTFSMNSGGYGGGVYMNLANYFHDDDHPSVFCGSGCGYMFEHDGGTTIAGKIYVRGSLSNVVTQVNIDTNGPFWNVGLGTDLSAKNIPYIAFGQGI